MKNNYFKFNFNNFIPTGFSNQIGYNSYIYNEEYYLYDWLNENIGSENYRYTAREVYPITRYIIIDCVDDETYTMLITLIEINK